MDNELWVKIEFSLAEIRDLLEMQLESQRAAVGKQYSPGTKNKKAVWRDASPRWVDDDHGVGVRPWQLIPYVDAIDQDMLRERLETGRELFSSVQKRIEAKELCPELLHEWGLLRSCVGALEIVYHARPDIGDLRRGSNNLDDQKYWFARRFLDDFRRMNKGDALEKAEEEINRLYNELDPGAERDWFEKFFSQKASLSLEHTRRLTNAFSSLSKNDMERIIDETKRSIPYADGSFPDP